MWPGPRVSDCLGEAGSAGDIVGVRDLVEDGFVDGFWVLLHETAVDLPGFWRVDLCDFC